MRESVAVIQHVLEKCDKIAISFNGGKDATVVLHLVRLVCLIEANKCDDVTPHSFFKRHFTCFVIHNDPQFREVAQFFVWADQKYNLNTTVYAGSTFPECL